MSERAVFFLAVSSEAQAADDRASLAEQERALREAADREGWRVVDTIRIPGFSRAWYTYREFSDAAMRAGVDDPARMWAHWQSRDFDVLAAATFSRLGREQSIMAEVFGRTVDAGARLYAVQGGWIDAGNMRPMSAFAGMSSALELDELRRRHKFGMRGRVRKGLPANHVPATHRVIRDERGRPSTLIVDEAKRRLFDDIADGLVLHRLGTQEIDGWLRGRGHDIADGTVDRWLRSPIVWGHTAIAARGASRRKGWQWVFLDSEPAPAGVTICRHAHPAVWTGEQAAQLQAELVRRIQSTMRKRPAAAAFLFTGLIRCAECGGPVVYNTDHRKGHERLYLVCGLRKRGNGCTNPPIREDALHADLTALLAYYERTGQLTSPATADAQARRQARAAQVASEIEAAETQARTLIGKQAAAPVALAGLYDEQIAALGDRLAALYDERARLTSETAPAPGQSAALERLRTGGVAWFWSRPPAEQNQLLAHLLGRARFRVLNRRIVDVCE